MTHKRYRQVSSLFAWLSLKLLGFYLLVHENWAKKFKIGLENIPSPNNGDIVICNHVSWLDFLLFEYYYHSPQFCYIGKDSKLYKIGSIFESIFSLSANEHKATLNSNSTLKSLIEESRSQSLGPIVIFPESATTNGKALLSFELDLNEIQDSKSNIYISTIKYSNNIPPYVFGNLMSNVHSVADNLFNYATLKIFPMKNVLDVIEESNEYFSNSTVSNCLAYLARVKQVKVTAQSKQEFIQFYKKKPL